MPVRHAVVAGQFYPLRAETIERDVRHYIDNSHVDPNPAQVAALVVPHAGYIYSGPTAGFGYARIRGAKSGRVVLLGRSHRYSFEKPSIWCESGYESPLGILPVDEKFASVLNKTLGGGPHEPHLHEHTLEVQIPFLQVVAGVCPIVPVLFGNEAGTAHEEFGKSLAAMLEPGDLVIASTDLSHFLTEEMANKIDLESIRTVLSKNTKQLIDGLAEGTCSMCGGPAVVAAMACALARKSDDWKLLDYSTSAKASGDISRVVGYAAISMEYGQKENTE